MSGFTPSGTTNNEAHEQPAQTVAGDQVLESSRWLAPLNSRTLLLLQNAIGNRAVGQLLQTPDGEAGTTERATARATQTPEPVGPARPLIVSDDVKDLQPGQMRKAEFLDQLKSSVCSAAEDTFRDTMWSALGCPYIERWFVHYAGKDSQHVERALRRYAPELSRAGSASDYIPIVTERVRRGLSQWAETGEMTGVATKFAQGEMRRMTLQGLVSGALSAVKNRLASAKPSPK